MRTTQFVLSAFLLLLISFPCSAQNLLQGSIPLTDHYSLELSSDPYNGNLFSMMLVSGGDKKDRIPKTGGTWKDKDGNPINRDDVFPDPTATPPRAGGGWWHPAGGGPPIEYVPGKPKPTSVRPDLTPHYPTDANGKPIVIEIPFTGKRGPDKTAAFDWLKTHHPSVHATVIANKDAWRFHHDQYDKNTEKGTGGFVPSDIHNPLVHTGGHADRLEHEKEVEEAKKKAEEEAKKKAGVTLSQAFPR